ncbi:hypothetical protein EIP86_010900 [Pleurotus ostreatoroseus]|nr:hypothetical protein EIP86_010900 [Pleurotus ostreatoroseus]
MTYKTVPLLILSLVVFTPSGLSAPAPAPTPQDFNANADAVPSTPIPVDAERPPAPDGDAPSSTVTAFFTPAVFLNDYYSQPAPTPNDDAVLLMPEDPAFPAPTTAVYDDLAPQETPAITPDATTPPGDALPTTPTPDATYAMTDDTADSMTPPLTPSPTPTVPADSTTAASDSLTTSAASTASTSYSTRVLNPTATTATERKPQAHPADSRTTQETRKAALIGTILALTFLSGLITFSLCTGVPCRLRPSIRRKKRPVEDAEDGTKDRDKLLSEKGKSRHGKVPTPEIVVVPVLDADASPQPASPQVALPSQLVGGPWIPSVQPKAGQQQQQQLQYPNPLDAEDEENVFEDVTHILSEETFQADVESSDDSNSSSHRTSHGAASVTAESYATCESRYSSGTRASREASSASFLSMSPPESPMLRTPTQPQYATMTIVPGRPRSKTLTQPASPLLDKHLSSSKSLPARYSGRELLPYAGGEGESVFEDDEDSEWDIAEAYAARMSKNSVGVVQMLSPIAEHAMEAVQIGERSCVLVQG